MNLQRYNNYKKNMVSVFWISIFVSIFCVIGMIGYKLSGIYLLMSVLFVVLSFLGMWFHAFKHGQKFETEYPE